MEDAHTIGDVKGMGLISIFDGHGGPQTARYCSNNIVNVLEQEMDTKENLGECLKDAYLKMDNDMGTPEGSEELAKIEKPDYYDNQILANGKCDLAKDIGNTALSVILHEGHITIGNVGDCRCLLVRGDEVTQLTTDHRPNAPGEAKRIAMAGGVIRGGRVNGNLSLTRSLGDHQYKKGSNVDKYVISPVAEITECDLQGDEELLILGCDGIWDVMSNEDIVSAIKEVASTGQSLEDVCGSIVSKCLATNPYEQAGSDNMTLVIAVLDQAKDKWRRCCAGCDALS